jgi:hypothetical protein
VCYKKKVIGGFESGSWSTKRHVRVVAWLLGTMMRGADLRFILVAAAKPA